jgi:uncharacterized metal-binding protein YceD (DUF177 family)
MTSSDLRGRAALGQPFVWNVSGLLAEPPGATRDYRVAGATLDLDEDLRLAQPVEGTVHVGRTNRGVLVHAELTTALDAECSRCLREIEVPIELSIDEEALPSVDVATGQPVDLAAEPDVLRLTAHHELDLEQTVREAIQLAEPIAPLCRPDCAGLCVVCGGRLDEGDHDHPTDDIDPRFEVLRSFKPER